MNEGNTKKLISRFKFIPQKNPLFYSDISMPMSFDCDDGWFDLLWKLCEDIDTVLTDDNSKTFLVDQVKEKYGTLRFYTSWINDKIDELINKAESLSAITCEICGNGGKLMVCSGWYKTLCKNHGDMLGYEIEDDRYASKDKTWAEPECWREPE